MIELQLSSERGISLYRQLFDQIKLGILTKRIQPGEQLPSVREMSKTLNINPLTVAKAYLELEHQGFVTTRWGKGTFVSERPPLLKEEEETRLNELIDRFITEVAPLMDNPKTLPGLIRERLKRG